MFKKQMLIVDDNYALREALKAVFEDEYHLSFATNGQEALKVVYSSKPQIILMDYRMPGLDGLETMEYMRKLTPDSKMVIMSAFDDRESVASFYRGGAFDFVGKPFNVYEIKEVVENASTHATKITNFVKPVKMHSPVISQNELDELIDETLKVACM